MYYVYEWFIVETGEIIYVGKGTKNRYKVRKRNKLFNKMILENECDSRIIKRFETEKDAFTFECERIKELKKSGQCVCNIHAGGAGGLSEYWTDELRQEYSEHNVMKTNEQKIRMSQNNPMKNKTIAKKVNAKKQKSIIIDGIEYQSIKDVCDKYNVSQTTVNGWCVNGTTSGGESCCYKDLKNIESYKSKNNGQPKALIYKGVVYKSSVDLANSIGISQTTASRWCRNGRDSIGNSCEYIEDKRKNKNIVSQKNIPVVINGIFYSSKSQASRALGITSYTLSQYLNGNLHNDKYICEYGNQHPSRENTDNSITEGSTTNK